VARVIEEADPLCLLTFGRAQVAAEFAVFLSVHVEGSLVSSLILLYTLMMDSVNIVIIGMQKKVGRPPGVMPPYKPFQMKVPESFLALVDDWRRKQPDLPSRAEAIRRLVASAIAAEGKKRK
jgi:hypothetical protein